MRVEPEDIRIKEIGVRAVKLMDRLQSNSGSCLIWMYLQAISSELVPFHWINPTNVDLCFIKLVVTKASALLNLV